MRTRFACSRQVGRMLPEEDRTVFKCAAFSCHRSEKGISKRNFIHFGRISVMHVVKWGKSPPFAYPLTRSRARSEGRRRNRHPPRRVESVCGQASTFRGNLGLVEEIPQKASREGADKPRRKFLRHERHPSICWTMIRKRMWSINCSSSEAI